MSDAPAAGPLSAPAPLSSSHQLDRFDCGKASLNDWLRQRALRSEGKSARCFVACVGKEVVAYYAMAAGAVARERLSGKLARNMPEAVPVVVIGRMAIDTRYQGRGLGAALLKDAFVRILNAAREIGARAVLVHAIDDDVVAFYARYGFKPLPGEVRTLFLPLEDIAAAL